MEFKEFPQLQEKLYYEQLDNGLDVYMLPKPGFNKSFATFTTKYGSIDNHFVPIGQTDMKLVPDGIAHFLEHKMFEKEDYDVFEKFSIHSASSNAFTSFTRTCYLFSCTNDLKENLMTLIDFVQSPYFTEQTVEKEKGIIAQEIKMYDDNPDFRSYYEIIGNLFDKHPVKIDIAGTVESIQPITAELLYECYNTFYHPSNMLLFVIGDFDVEEMMKLVRENQAKKDYQKQSPIPREYPKEEPHAVRAESILEMEVGTAKVFVGIKDVNTSEDGNYLLRKEVALDIIFDLMFGSSSAYYEEMLDKGYINDTFGYETNCESSFGFSMIGGDTRYPNELAQSIKEKLLLIPTMIFDEEEFNRIKNKKVGRFLSALNSVEFIANQFTQYAFNGVQLFSILDILEQLTIADLEKLAKDYFVEDRMSIFKLLPKKA
ncbi:MAG: insulinase family protein [Turicibacter sp.]|nr:insulinase family protein [Turicibacter sp.]